MVTKDTKKSTTADKPPPKKRGRPKKVEVIDNSNNKGVVNAPQDKANIIELEYGNPLLFKKCVTLLKGYSASELIWQFKKDCVEIRAKDHLDSSKIFFSIDCKNVISYYCKQEHTISFKLETVEDLFKAIRKDKTIKFVIEENTKNSQFTIIIPNIADGILSSTSINLINNSTNANFNGCDDSKYSIRMSLTIDYLKRIFTRIGNKTDRLYIIKYPKKDLNIEYRTNSIVSKNTIVDPAKVDLKCDLDDNAFLWVELLLSQIKPLSSSSKDHTLKIAIDKSNLASFTIILDQIEISELNGENVEKYVKPVCTFKLYTELKDESDK